MDLQHSCTEPSTCFKANATGVSTRSDRRNTCKNVWMVLRVYHCWVLYTLNMTTWLTPDCTSYIQSYTIKGCKAKSGPVPRRFRTVSTIWKDTIFIHASVNAQHDSLDTSDIFLVQLGCSIFHFRKSTMQLTKWVIEDVKYHSAISKVNGVSLIWIYLNHDTFIKNHRALVCSCWIIGDGVWFSCLQTDIGPVSTHRGTLTGIVHWCTFKMIISVA